MRKIYTFLCIALLASCATSSISTQSLDHSRPYYTRILTCLVDKPLTIQTFDATFYDASFKKNFNNLANLQVRNQMERTMQRNLAHQANTIIPSSDIFITNEDISYDEFKDRIDSAHINAILLINEEQTWDTPNYTRNGRNIDYNGQPNTAFHCYLIDAESGKIMWMGRCVVRGIFAGYDTLNNYLARRVAKKLRQEGFIN